MRLRGRDSAMRAADAADARETEPIVKASQGRQMDVYERLSEAEQSSMATVWGASAFYALIGAAFACRLLWNLAAFPIYPFKMDSAAWAGAWLITTIGDYYVVAFCLSGIIIATEGLAKGIAWALAINLLGSPFACAYLIYKLLTQRSLAMAKRPSE
mmetsp:Transcript_45289/g.107771  ORF Transcript_45289/g.107771 Transcript_45289/m.107771 type:complete len:157 (-) Transcript_45289:181-651(-)